MGNYKDWALGNVEIFSSASGKLLDVYAIELYIASYFIILVFLKGNKIIPLF